MLPRSKVKAEHELPVIMELHGIAKHSLARCVVEHSARGASYECILTSHVLLTVLPVATGFHHLTYSSDLVDLFAWVTICIRVPNIDRPLPLNIQFQTRISVILRFPCQGNLSRFPVVAMPAKYCIEGISSGGIYFSFNAFTIF